MSSAKLIFFGPSLRAADSGAGILPTGALAERALTVTGSTVSAAAGPAIGVLNPSGRSDANSALTDGARASPGETGGANALETFETSFATPGRTIEPLAFARIAPSPSTARFAAATSAASPTAFTLETISRRAPEALARGTGGGSRLTATTSSGSGFGFEGCGFARETERGDALVATFARSATAADRAKEGGSLLFFEPAAGAVFWAFGFVRNGAAAGIERRASGCSRAECARGTTCSSSAVTRAGARGAFDAFGSVVAVTVLARQSNNAHECSQLFSG
jgi:hypothetical protein